MFHFGDPFLCGDILQPRVMFVGQMTGPRLSNHPAMRGILVSDSSLRVRGRCSDFDRPICLSKSSRMASRGIRLGEMRCVHRRSFCIGRGTIAASSAPKSRHSARLISKEPLGPVVRKDDAKWIGLVRWTLFALINAEELGLDSKSIAAGQGQRAIELAAPATKSLGLANDWLVKVIVGVGNYAEIFERNLGENTPLALGRGVNALWTQGGLLYPPPMQ